MELSLILIVLYMCGTSAISNMPELKHNILRFGYGVNFSYEGMLSHSFDRFYVVMKIEIPNVSGLNLTLFQFDHNCSHVVNIEKGMRFTISSTIKEMFDVYCKNIIPYVDLMIFSKIELKFVGRQAFTIIKHGLLPGLRKMLTSSISTTYRCHSVGVSCNFLWTLVILD